MKSAVLGSVLALLCGAAIVATSSREVLNGVRPAQLEAGQQGVPAGAIALLEKPGQFVPFRASTTRVFNPGNVFIGVFYRSSDGSTRSETGPANGEINSAAINNMAEKTHYRWVPNSGWESHPMDLPFGKYIPPIPDGTFSDRPIVEQIEGMDLIAMPREPSGAVQFVTPQLNYFAVKILHPCTKSGATGCGFWMSDIQIGEQPEELFKPPSGDQVLRRSEPGGVTRGVRPPPAK